MTMVISRISDFDYFLYNLKSNWSVNFQSQTGILDSYLVVFNDFSMFEKESKFCQNPKFFMTAVISEISNFDHFHNNLKCNW